MQITLNLSHRDIEIAIRDFINNQGVKITDDTPIKLLCDETGVVSAIVDMGATPIVNQKASTVPSSTKENISKPAVTETDDDDDYPDREEMKAKLDALGITYAPKARTSTLIELLEEAEVNAPVMAEVVHDPNENVFTAPVEEPSFNTEEEPKSEFHDEDEDDNTSLFGN